MEKKFHYTRLKNSIQKATTRSNDYCNSLEEQNNNEQQSEQKKLVADLAVVPSKHQANKDLTKGKQKPKLKPKRILQGLAIEYHKLVRDIEWYLPDSHLPNSGVRLAAEASQRISPYRQLGGEENDLKEKEVEKDTSQVEICFVQLFRQRMYYEELGIPLTPLELIYMTDCDREWRRREQAKKSMMDQDQQKQHQYRKLDRGDGHEQEYALKSQRNEAQESKELKHFNNECIWCQAVQREQETELPSPPPADHQFAYSQRCESTLKAEQHENQLKCHELRRTQKFTNLPEQVVAQMRSQQACDNEMKMLLAPRTTRLQGDRDVVVAMRGQQEQQPTNVESSDSLAEFSTESKSSCCLLTSEMSASSSIDELSVVWYNPYAYQQVTVENRSSLFAEFKSIDAQQTGHKGAQVLDDRAAELALQRVKYLNNRYELLQPEERTIELAQRLRHLRFFLEKAKHKFYKQLKIVESRTRVRQQLLYDCPMHAAEKCTKVMNETLLAHFIGAHLQAPGLRLNEISDHSKQLIKFEPVTFSRTSNICMSIALLDEFRHSTIPSTIHNGGLSLAHRHYASYLPFFVMARRIWLPTETVEEDGENAMALWIVSLDLAQCIYAHLTVFNRRLDVSRCGIVRVRGLSSNHKPEEFMAQSTNYLRLTAQDLRVLTNNYKECIYMEVYFREFTDYE